MISTKLIKMILMNYKKILILEILKTILNLEIIFGNNLIQTDQVIKIIVFYQIQPAITTQGPLEKA